MEKGRHIYIMTNKRHTVLYTDLVNRIWKHKNNVYSNSFTAKYNCDKLIYYLVFSTIEEAIAAEK